MRLLVYMPDDPALRAGLEEILRRSPATRRIEIASLGADGLKKEIDSADPKHGFVVVDPPRGAADLKRFDELCGPKRLPRAVFYAPAKRKQDPAWRDAMKEPYHYFHRARRSFAFAKPTVKALGKTVKLASKTDSLLRWGLLGPMAAATLVLVLGLFLFRDALLKRVAVAGLQMAFGAKADVTLLGSTLAPSFNLADVAVADKKKPMSNLFQFDTLKADVNAGPLFSGRLHAEEVRLEGLRFGGERATSGALPGAEPPAPEPVPDPSTEPSFEKALEDLLKRLEPPALDDLQTVRRAREIEKESRERLARYQALSAKNPYKDRIDQARRSSDELKNLKPPASVDQAVKEISGLRPDAALIDKARGDLEGAKSIDLGGETKSIEAARKEVEGVKAGLDDAKATVDKAKEIKKASLLDAPKIAQLLKDLAKAQKTLEAAPAKLDGARKTLEDAKKESTRKQTEAAQRLKSADDSLAAAKKALDSGADGSAKLAQLGPKLAQARSDLEKYRGEVEGKLKASKADLDAARKDVDGFRKSVQDDLEYMRKAPASLQEALEADRKELLARYDLNQFSAEELVRTLLGEEAAKYVRWTLSAHQTLKPYLNRPKEPKAGKVPAEGGAIYSFPGPEEPRQPRVWIKKATFKGAISLQGEKGTLEGTATHLSTDPALVGETARLEMRARAGPRSFTLALTISPKGELAAEISVEGFELKGGALKNKYLTADLGNGAAAVKGTLKLGEGALRADGQAAFTGLKLQPAPGGDARLSFVGDVFKGIDRLDARFELEGSEKGMSAFRVRSDQVSDLTGKLRGAVTGRVEDAKKKALSGLDAQVAGPRKQAEQAAAQFLSAAPGAADGVTGGLSFDGADGADALGRIDSLQKLLSGNLKSDELTAALRKDLDGLSAQSAARKDQNSKDGAAQAGAADAALQAAGAQKEALGGIQAQVTEQIDRLKKLK